MDTHFCQRQHFGTESEREHESEGEHATGGSHGQGSLAREHLWNLFLVLNLTAELGSAHDASVFLA